MAKPILFWDFDGVMADSTEFVYHYWRQEFNRLGFEFGPEDYQATFTYKLPFDQLREKFGSAADEIYVTYTEHEAKHYPDQVEPFRGFIDGFLQVADKFEHHLVSSNLEVVIKPWLKRFELQSYFTSVVGRESPGYKNEKITQHLEKAGVKASEALFIGDTISDVEHGQAAGVKTVAVTWGVHSRAMLEPTKPDFMCDSLAELFTLLHDACE